MKRRKGLEEEESVDRSIESSREHRKTPDGHPLLLLLRRRLNPRMPGEGKRRTMKGEKWGNRRRRATNHALRETTAPLSPDYGRVVNVDAEDEGVVVAAANSNWSTESIVRRHARRIEVSNNRRTTRKE